MKKLSFFILFFAVSITLHAQLNRTTRLFSYVPAPGQFINTSQLGTPLAAQQVADSTNKLVSLGAFGGSIVLGFEKPVYNHPLNPYGIDFTIFGNAFPGSSEPGFVWVMKDSNGNGIPDDTWLQIAGSSFYDPHARRHCEVKWFPLPDGGAGWSVSGVMDGTLQHNEFHAQNYYPDLNLFKGYPSDTMKFKSDLLNYHINRVDGQIKMPALAFGYADNMPVNQGVSGDIPDNPYTPLIQEGAGGDPVDISWAVDSTGRYVYLDRIDFIRITTGTIAANEFLGEISVEVSGAVASKPTGEVGPEDIAVIHPHPFTVISGDTIQFSATFFRKGIVMPDSLIWEVAGDHSGQILPDGKFFSRVGGQFTVLAYPATFPDKKTSTIITVREPDSLVCLSSGYSLQPGEEISCQPLCLDQYGMEIKSIKWVVEAADSSILHISSSDTAFVIHAIKEGLTTLKISTLRFPGFIRTINLTVRENSVALNVYATAKTRDANLLPARWFSMDQQSITAKKAAGGQNTALNDGFNLVEVAAVLFQKAGINVDFRAKNADGTDMFIYSAETGGIFTYGWGGKTEPSAYARCWFLRVNGRHYYDKLETIYVSDGDTIIIYHVNNILEYWNLTFLTSNNDSVSQGDELKLKISSVQCIFTPGSGITESAPVPLNGRELYISGQAQPLGFTGSDGSAWIEVSKMPPFTISSGPDAISIANKLITGIDRITKPNLTFYPNPAHKFLHISGLSGDFAVVHLYDTASRIVREIPLNESRVTISLDNLRPGIYICHVKEKVAVYQQIIVVQ